MVPCACRTVLLTGFGSFPGVEHNATADLVPRLAKAARRRFRSRRFRFAILPTDWQHAPARLAALYRDMQPDLILHFGVSRQATGFVIEKMGHNRCSDTADVSGLRPPSTSLSELGPPTLQTRLPTDTVLARLAAKGLPVSASDDAGGYLCNAVLYRSLLYCDTAPHAPRAGFVHVPATLGAAGGGLTLAQGVSGGLEIIASCLPRPR